MGKGARTKRGEDAHSRGRGAFSFVDVLLDERDTREERRDEEEEKREKEI